MPAKKTKITINLDLLHPQSSPEKLPIKFLKWLLSSGRYILIFVEALVLIAFITRFKLDADIADIKEKIDEQIPFIESLRPYEIIIRETQLKLATIKAFYVSGHNYPQILKKIADQTPLSVKIASINLEKGVGKVSVSVIAQAQTSSDLSTFIIGLKENEFDTVTLTNIGLEQGVIRFSVTFDAVSQTTQGKSL